MKKTVVAFGSFDVLHPGHIHYLREASKYGNLIVIVARDRSITMLKGRKPLVDEKSRLEIIQSLRFVHKAILGERIRRWNDVYKILLKVRPEVIVLGYDQRVDSDYMDSFLKKNGLSPKIVRIGPFKRARFKSSKLKKLISRY